MITKFKILNNKELLYIEFKAENETDRQELRQISLMQPFRATLVDDDEVRIEPGPQTAQVKKEIDNFIEKLEDAKWRLKQAIWDYDDGELDAKDLKFSLRQRKKQLSKEIVKE